MKTKCTVLVLFACIFTLLNCTENEYESGAELIAPKQLKIKEGYKAYLVTDKEGQTSLLIENDIKNAKLKEPSEIWKCSCGLINDTANVCIITSEEGSNTAVCTGSCLCGFYPVLLPTVDDIKGQVFTSKKLLIDNIKA